MCWCLHISVFDTYIHCLHLNNTTSSSSMSCTFFPRLISNRSYLFLFFFSLLPTLSFFFFFFNDTATTEIYTLSLHDALPICVCPIPRHPLSERSSLARRGAQVGPSLACSSNHSRYKCRFCPRAIPKAFEIGRAHV